MSTIRPIQLKDFCQLFGFKDREVRYVLEQGYVPKGVDISPSTGNRREFGPGSAFWLAIAIKLKQSGVKTPLAANLAERTVEGLRTLTQNLSWDWTFLPMRGWFDTDHEYFLDVGDLQYIRLVTDANPSEDGLYEFEWSSLVGRRRIIRKVAPFVNLRVDLTQIAGVLAQVEGWSCPHRR